MKNATHSIKTTLSAALLAVLGTANFASLPTAAVTGSASIGSAAWAVAAQAAPWLGLGAGLVLGNPAVAATNKPVAGVGVKICKNPGGSSACITNPGLKSGADGNFQINGLKPGDYDVTPDGGKTVILQVGADGKLGGVVQEEGGVRSVVKLRPGGLFPGGSAVDSSRAKPSVEIAGQSGPSSADKGIKDNGVRSCNGCGMTGKVAAPAPDATAVKPAAQ